MRGATEYDDAMSTTTTETRPRVSTEHIEITPGVCGGKPRIAGHRIRVQDIYVWHELQGQTAEEIVTRATGGELDVGAFHRHIGAALA